MYIIIILCSVIGLMFWVDWLLSNKTRWRYSLPAISWLFHAIVFSVTALLNPFAGTDWGTAWMFGLFLHGVIYNTTTIFIVRTIFPRKGDK